MLVAASVALALRYAWIRIFNYIPRTEHGSNRRFCRVSIRAILRSPPVPGSPIMTWEIAAQDCDKRRETAVTVLDSAGRRRSHARRRPRSPTPGAPARSPNFSSRGHRGGKTSPGPSTPPVPYVGYSRTQPSLCCLSKRWKKEDTCNGA